jgi:hypothetical protein
LQSQKKSIEASGFGLAVITYDSPATLSHFAARMGIQYPMLSDQGSKTIRAFNILNESIPVDNPFHGVPHPGTYVVNRNGIVQSKYFEQDYRERYTAAAILTRDASSAGANVIETETRHLKLRTWASNDIAYGGSRIALMMEIDLPPGMHVYSPAVQSTYIPVRWNLKESSAWRTWDVTWPPHRMLHLAAIKETVPVYEGKLRLTRDVTISQEKGLQGVIGLDRTLPIEGSFRYQACDENVCYVPQTVPLKWTVQVQPHDRTRVPAELRGTVR